MYSMCLGLFIVEYGYKKGQINSYHSEQIHFERSHLQYYTKMSNL